MTTPRPPACPCRLPPSVTASSSARTSTPSTTPASCTQGSRRRGLLLRPRHLEEDRQADVARQPVEPLRPGDPQLRRPRAPVHELRHMAPTDPGRAEGQAHDRERRRHRRLVGRPRLLQRARLEGRLAPRRPGGRPQPLPGQGVALAVLRHVQRARPPRRLALPLPARAGRPGPPPGHPGGPSTKPSARWARTPAPRPSPRSSACPRPATKGTAASSGSSGPPTSARSSTRRSTPWPRPSALPPQDRAEKDAEAAAAKAERTAKVLAARKPRKEHAGAKLGGRSYWATLREDLERLHALRFGTGSVPTAGAATRGFSP